MWSKIKAFFGTLTFLEYVIIACIAFIVLLCISTTGCRSEPNKTSQEQEFRFMMYKLQIPEELKASSRHWTLKCIAAANPQSDEEPEDMIKQCEYTALELFGVNTRLYRIQPAAGPSYWRDADKYDAEVSDKTSKNIPSAPAPERWDDLNGPEALGSGKSEPRPEG